MESCSTRNTVMKFFPTLFILVNLINVSAQDPHFTHYKNSEWYVNPAWIGGDSANFISVKNRHQWPSIKGSYVTTTAIYSHNFKRISGNIYGAILHDNASEGMLKTTRLSLGYSHQFEINELIIRPGVNLTYQSKILDWNKLTFGDQIDPRRGFIYDTNDLPRGGHNGVLDISSGLFLSYKGIDAGISFQHMNQPNDGLLGTYKSPIPMKIGAQMLYRYAMGAHWLFTPNYFFETQGSFDKSISSYKHIVGLNVRYKWLEIGGGIRSQDAQLFQVGLIDDKFEIYYSYDKTISRFQNATGGSHEISLRVNFVDWK